MAKTVVGLYDDLANARETVQDLMDHTFSREEISLITRDVREDRTRAVGHEEQAALSVEGEVAARALSAMLAGSDTLVLPGVGAVIAAGPIVPTVTGLAAGAGLGAIVGALIGLGLPEREAQYYAEGLRRGGTLVAVRTEEDRVDEAADVMESHDPVDIHERAAGWRREGWTPTEPRF